FLGEHLVPAVYSSTCGGHTEDNDVVWGDAPNAALRGRPDFDVHAHPELEIFAQGLSEANLAAWVSSAPKSYCAKASRARADRHRWQRSFSASELAPITAKLGIGALRDVEIHGRGKGGRV